MFHQVNFKEHPTPASLGARDDTGTRLVLERDRMDMQKFRRLLESESFIAHQKLLIQVPGTGPPNSNFRTTPLREMLFMICVRR